MSPENSGELSGSGWSVKRNLRASTGQVEWPGAAPMRIDTPLRKGSVFDAGRSRRTCVGFSREGTKVTDSLVRLTAGLNASLSLSVNSPQRRKPAHATFVAASNEASKMHDLFPATDASFWRTSRVIGCLGTLSFSPKKRLIPRIARCTVSDSHASNGSPSSTWSERMPER